MYFLKTLLRGFYLFIFFSRKKIFNYTYIGILVYHNGIPMVIFYYYTAGLKLIYGK